MSDNTAGKGGVVTLRAPGGSQNDNTPFSLSNFMQEDGMMKESALEAASKLESQYELTYKTIDEVRRAIDDMKQVRNKNASEEVESTVQSGPFHFSNVAPESKKDEHSVSFQFGDISFQMKEEPIHNRLISYGQALKEKREKMREEAEKNVGTHKPEITEAAKNIKRNEPIVNVLMKRRMEHEVKMDEMRKAKEEKEMSQLSSPQISEHAKSLRRSEPAHERLFESRRLNLDKREQLKNRLEQQQNELISGKPKINKVSQNLNRTWEDQLEWAAAKEQRNEALRKRKEEEDKRIMQKPKINAISARLAGMRDRGANIHEHLLEQHKRKQEEKLKMIMEEKAREMNSSVPTISAHSSNLQRNDQVFDRLYNASIEAEEKKRREIEIIEECERRNIDVNTGRRMHSPRINRRSHQMVRSEPIEEVLLRKAAEKQAKLEWAKQMEEQQIADFQNVKVGEYSRFLADLLERKTNTTSQERLLGPKSNNTSSSTSMIAEEEIQCTFRPKINDNSRHLDRSLSAQSTPRSVMLLKKGDEYEDRRKQLKERITQQRMSDCTFSPRFSSPNRMKLQRSGSSTIAERSQEWSRKTDKKIELERQQTKQKELEGCTFKPVLSGDLKKRSQSSGSFLKGSFVSSSSYLEDMSISIAPNHSVLPNDNSHIKEPIIAVSNPPNPSNSTKNDNLDLFVEPKKNSIVRDKVRITSARSQSAGKQLRKSHQSSITKPRVEPRMNNYTQPQGGISVNPQSMHSEEVRSAATHSRKRSSNNLPPRQREKEDVQRAREQSELYYSTQLNETDVFTLENIQQRTLRSQVPQKPRLTRGQIETTKSNDRVTNPLEFLDEDIR